MTAYIQVHFLNNIHVFTKLDYFELLEMYKYIFLSMN